MLGQERSKRQLLLNWMAETLEEAIHRANSTGRPELRFVLTASGERYMQPELKSFSRWQKPSKEWEPRTAFVLELLQKIENILWDRDLFDNNCLMPNQNGDHHMPGSPTQEPHIGHSAFLKLLRKADIVGKVGGMVDEQHAFDVYLKLYHSRGSRNAHTLPRIPFHVFQQCLWNIGRHSAMVDVIPDPELLDPASSPQVSGVHEATKKEIRFDIRSMTLTEPRKSLESSNWKSPREIYASRPRSAAIPNGKVAVPGPDVYVKHLFAPFPNESIFPGATSSKGGTKGWTFRGPPACNSTGGHQFMKDTLQEIGCAGLSPGPASYGDNNCGMTRAQLGYGTGRLPANAKHAQFGTAERELAVSHVTVSTMRGGITCELLQGKPQLKRPMLRKGDSKMKNLDVSTPTQQQLKESRKVLEFMFQLDFARMQPPPSSMVRTGAGDTYVQTPRGVFEKLDFSAVRKLDIELPLPVKETCFLLRDVSKDSKLFDSYSTTGPGDQRYLELLRFLTMLRDLEILGRGQHQVNSDVAQIYFTRVGGRWATGITLNDFFKCLRIMQEHLVFQALSTISPQSPIAMPSRTGTSAPHVNFSTENGIQEGENKGSKANALLEGTRDRPGTEAQPPEFLQNTATCRSLHSAPIDVGPGTYGVPNKDKTIERTRALGWKQEKGWDFATQERPVPDCSVRLGYFAGNCYKTFLGSPRHAHCGSEIPRTSNMRKNPSATFGLSPRFSNPPPYPP